MIAIIGAGPVGCYLASLLADDFEVIVFEEHKSVGLPVQCTGIVTSEIYNFVPRKNNFVINKADEVHIYAPNGRKLKLRLEKPDLIIDRQRFDSYFFNQAKKKGVKFYFYHKYILAKGKKVLIKDLKSNKIKKFGFTHLVGADGSRSEVAKTNEFYNKRRYFIGVQATIKKKNTNTIDFYPFKDGFGWSVPENNNTLRVGVASTTNPKQEFKKLLGKHKGKVVAKQGGLIPVFNLWSGFRKENIFLVGDAAGFVKATTGGGIVPGLRSAEILAHSLKNNLGYEAGIYLHLFPSLWLNLKSRKIMNSFSPKDWNQIIKDLDNPKSKKVLQKVNRDRIFELILKISFNNPCVMTYGFKHFKALF